MPNGPDSNAHVLCDQYSWNLLKPFVAGRLVVLCIQILFLKKITQISNVEFVFTFLMQVVGKFKMLVNLWNVLLAWCLREIDDLRSAY